MAAGEIRIGLDGVFNYGTAGSQANVEAEEVDDVVFSGTAKTAERMKRHATFVSTRVTYLDGALKFTIQDEESSAFFTAVETAWINKDLIAFYPTRVASGKGLDADYSIVNFEVTEKNDQFCTASVEAKPSDELRDPVWQ